jgi:hypothetical protein
MSYSTFFYFSGVSICSMILYSFSSLSRSGILPCCSINANFLRDKMLSPHRARVNQILDTVSVRNYHIGTGDQYSHPDVLNLSVTFNFLSEMRRKKEETPLYIFDAEIQERWTTFITLIFCFFNRYWRTDQLCQPQLLSRF